VAFAAGARADQRPRLRRRVHPGCDLPRLVGPDLPRRPGRHPPRHLAWLYRPGPGRGTPGGPIPPPADFGYRCGSCRS
jgi:hypothetical protein